MKLRSRHLHRRCSGWKSNCPEIGEDVDQGIILRINGPLQNVWNAFATGFNWLFGKWSHVIILALIAIFLLMFFWH